MWLGTCVGKSNYHRFYAFVFFTCLEALLTLALSLKNIAYHQKILNDEFLMLPKEEQLEEPTFLHTMEAYPFSMFVIIYGLVMGLFVMMLLLFHTHLITNFKSTQE
jgi:hypothetical protein